MVHREPVFFQSSSARCAGYLYRNAADTRPFAWIIMAHGFGGTQQGSLTATARDFAAAGFQVLTFDYRGFGESEGEPRQVVDISAQQADWRAAIAFLRTLGGTDPDRIALWGSSLAGAHVVTLAAKDPSIAAVVAQVPFNGFPRSVDGRSRKMALRLLREAGRDWLRGRLGRPPVYVKQVGAPGELAVIGSAEAQETVRLMSNLSWRNEVAPRGLVEMLWYRPSRHASRVKCPLLVCLAERDRETPAELARPIAVRAPRGELRAYPCTHFQLYGDAVRPAVVADQLSFLRTHLIGFDAEVG